MKYLKYLGFLGFLGCFYFINYKLSVLSGFLFFSFFNLYFVEKLKKFTIENELKIRLDKISSRVFLIPFLVLFCFANGYNWNQPMITIISIITIIITFNLSTMIPYLYVKRELGVK